MGKSISEAVIAEIRQRRQNKETIKSIAAVMGVSITTVNKYASDLNLKIHARREQKRYRAMKRDAETMATRRDRSREYYRAKRNAASAVRHEQY